MQGNDTDPAGTGELSARGALLPRAAPPPGAACTGCAYIMTMSVCASLAGLIYALFRV